MSFNLEATLIFVVVTTFTPGPNNLLSASMGVNFGYRRTFPFLAGVTAGFMIVMMLGATLSSSLVVWLPSVAPFLRYVGATYILYLAYGVYRRSRTLLSAGADDAQRPRFWKGFLLQFVNPKGCFYGLTIYTTFLAPLLERPLVLVVSPVVLSIVTFAAISTWSLGGNMIRGWISTPARAQVLGAGLALALVYTALDVAGVFSVLKAAS